MIENKDFILLNILNSVDCYRHKITKTWGKIFNNVVVCRKKVNKTWNKRLYTVEVKIRQKFEKNIINSVEVYRQKITETWKKRLYTVEVNKQTIEKNIKLWKFIDKN